MTRTMQTAAAGCLLAVLGTLGCASSVNQEGAGRWVDPCWPERYSSVARQEVLDPFAAQAMNGAIIDATVWNYHFESQSDKLTPAGMEKVDYLVRRRPTAETRLFVQTARDLSSAADVKAKRDDLDAKRVKAVKDYYTAQAAAKGATPDVQVIDPSDPSIPARYPGNSFNSLPGQYRSTLQGAAAGAGGGGGGGMATGGR